MATYLLAAAAGGAVAKPPAARAPATTSMTEAVNERAVVWVFIDFS
jgi:hypothetical protein